MAFGVDGFNIDDRGAQIQGSYRAMLTLVSGAGVVARNSIGIVLVGGMAIGTLFTLFVVPSLYVLIAHEHSRRVRLDEREVETTQEFAAAE